MGLLDLFRPKNRRRHIVSSSRISNPQQMKSRLESMSYSALLAEFRSNPELAVSFAKHQLGYKDEPLGKKLLAEAVESDPTVRDKLIQQQLASEGLSSNDPMQQFIAVQEFMDRYGGGERKGSGLVDALANSLAKLAENPMVGAAAANLIVKLTDGMQNGNRTFTPQHRTQIEEIKPAQLTVSDQESTPQELSVSNNKVVEMTQQYLSKIVELIEQRTSPKSLAEFILNGFVEIFRTENDLGTDHQHSDIMQNIIQQNSDGIIVMLKVLASQNPNEQRFKYAIEFFGTDEGRQYLDQFCTERDILVEQYNSQVNNR